MVRTLISTIAAALVLGVSPVAIAQHTGAQHANPPPAAHAPATDKPATADSHKGGGMMMMMDHMHKMPAAPAASPSTSHAPSTTPQVHPQAPQCPAGTKVEMDASGQHICR